MEQSSNIRLLNTDLKASIGTDIDIVAILTNVEIATTKTEAKYAKLSLLDKTTQLTANVWDLNLIHIPTLETNIGQLVKLSGKVKTFGVNNTISFNVTAVKFINVTELIDYNLTMEDFYNTVENKEKLEEELINYLDQISNTYYGKIAKQAIMNNWSVFTKVAGGKTVHHTMLGGLLQHTLEVIKTIDTIYELSVRLNYDNLNRALLIAGAALHDIGKCKEIETSAIGSSEYTIDSIFESHHISGIAMLVEAATQINLQNSVECAELKHIIAAHHERQEWGQLKEPALIEATLISKADYISAILNGTDKALKDVKAGELYKGYGNKTNWVKSIGDYNNDIEI